MAPDISKALVHKVTTAPAVSALIGARFYDSRLPQTVVTFPAVTYPHVSGGRLVHHHKEPSVLPTTRVQVSVFGVMGTHDLAAVDRAIREAIDGSRGTWGTGSYITEVHRCVAETTPFESFDLESGLYFIVRDYLIMYKE